MRELIYTTNYDIGNSHYVQRTVTEHHLRDSETGELKITKTTTFKCACGESELDGSISIGAYQELHQQLMEEAQ